MRKKFVIISILCFFLLASLFTVKPLIITLAKKQLGKVFVQSRISVARCALGANSLSFFDVEINRQGVYDVKVKEADIQYGLLLSFRYPFLKVFLKGANFRLDAPEKRINDIPVYFNLNQNGPQIISSVDISGLALDVNTQDLSLKAATSLSLNLIAQSLEQLDFKIDSFKMFGVELKNASLKLKGRPGQGDFNIPELKYDKLTVSDIKGKVKLEGMNLSLYEVLAKMLGGDVEGELDLRAGKEIQYSANLKCKGLDVERFVRDFDLREKFDMTGKLSGNLRLQGEGAKIKILDGNFSTIPFGGTLVISNTEFLENMARNTRQPVDLLVESFKNYTYNTGIMSLGLSGNDIIFSFKLEGQAGKRELNVIVHDFSF